MPKIIVVQGVSNSGKSRSIRLFASMHGVWLARPGDFILTMPVSKAGVTYNVCVVTGGDNPSMITAGVNFALHHKCDYIVAATKMSGATVSHMKSLITLHSFSDVWIKTRHVTGPSAQTADNSRVATEVDNEIP